MVGAKEKTWNWVNIKVAREVWKQAKVAATLGDKLLSNWIAEAIREKLEREKGGKG